MLEYTDRTQHSGMNMVCGKQEFTRCVKVMTSNNVIKSDDPDQ